LEIGHRKRGTIVNIEARSRISRRETCHMRRSLVALAAVSLSSAIGGASERPPLVQEVIHATPEKIKKAALAMFVPDGYTIDSDMQPTLANLKAKIERADQGH
jgi:hypothetical protein